MERILEYDGHQYTLRQLSDMSGLNKETIRSRLASGMTIKQAVEMPLMRKTKSKRPPAACGFTNMYDCLNCRYDRCISEDYPALPGENYSKRRWKDYDRR